MEFTFIICSAIVFVVIIPSIKIFFYSKWIEKSKRCSVRVDAVVSYRKVERVWGSEGFSNRVTIRCRYSYQDNTYTTDEMQVGLRHIRYKEGDPIELYVNPDDITDIMLKSANETKLGYRKIIGTVLGAIGIGIMALMMFIGFMINRVLSEKIDAKWVPKERAQITATPTPTAIPIPDNYIKGQYFGIELSIPEYFSKPIYAGNDVKSGHCYFTSKESSKNVFDIKVADNKTTVEKAMESLKNYVQRKSTSQELCKEVEVNGQIFEVYSVIDGRTEEKKNNYYAISASEKKKIIFTYYGEEEELYTIISSVKY